MARIPDVLRALFISPEFAFIAGIALLTTSWPGFFTPLGKGLLESAFSADNLYFWLPAIATAGSGAFGRRVLFPKQENRLLLEAPMYPAIKARVILGLLWGVVAFVGSVLLHVFGTESEVSVIGGAYLALVSAAFISLLTVFLAHLRIRQIVETSVD